MSELSAGPGIGAFFDVDGTLLEVNSGSKWLDYLRRRGEISLWRTVRSLVWLGEYKLSLLDFDSMAAKVIGAYKGREVAALEREVQRWYEDEIEATICREARERVAHHRAHGHVTALLTSATRFVSTPLARELQIEHILCTEVEVEAGVLTGKFETPACYGRGKVVHAEKFAREHHIDLDRSFFYSDSYTDLPMLERVGKPVVINPDTRLRRRAIDRGWGFESWSA